MSNYFFFEMTVFGSLFWLCKRNCAVIRNHATSTVRSKLNFYNYYRRVIDLFTKILTKCAGGMLTLRNFLCVIKLKLLFDSLETHDPKPARRVFFVFSLDYFLILYLQCS